MGRLWNFLADGSLGSWLINPVGNLVEKINKSLGNNPEQQPNHEPLLSGVNDAVSKVYDDLTGVTAINLQNDLNRQMAEEEYQRNLQSIGDTAAAYEAAGFNRNLMYSASPASYSAPNLQEYSGSGRLDTILSRVGKVLGIIPAMYQATAALEGIDQAREKTKQQQIKTMADGISLLNNSFTLGDNYYSHPFTPIIQDQHFKYKHPFAPEFVVNPQTQGGRPIYSPADLRSYIDASFRYKMDLLKSIGISNELRSTRNSYLGYQYELDRRFGAAGRIVGMGAQGLRAVGGLFSPIKLGGFK